MPFQLFHDVFPKVAERETRIVVLPMAQGGLPAGGYAFRELKDFDFVERVKQHYRMFREAVEAGSGRPSAPGKRPRRRLR